MLQQSGKPRTLKQRIRFTLIAGLVVLVVLPALGVVGLIVYGTVMLTQEVIHPAARYPLTSSLTALAAMGYPDTQEVTLTTSDGIQLKGWYIPPRGQAGRVVLLLHGHGGNREQMHNEVFSLVPRGVGVLLFDFRAHGESGGTTVTLGDKEQLDVAAALDWLSARPEVKRIDAVGFSMGAVVLTLSAARDTRIQSAVIAEPYADMDSLIWFHAKMFSLFSQIPAELAVRAAGVDPQHVQPVQELCKISPRPVLLIFGDKEDYLPLDSSQRMFAAAAACPSVQTWMVPGAGHLPFGETVPAEYERRLLEFLQVKQ